MNLPPHLIKLRDEMAKEIAIALNDSEHPGLIRSEMEAASLGFNAACEHFMSISEDQEKAIKEAAQDWLDNRFNTRAAINASEGYFLGARFGIQLERGKSGNETYCEHSGAKIDD